jgi:hypothetical protein
MRDRLQSFCAVIAVSIIGATMAACDIGYDDGENDECTNPSPPPPAPYLVPATLAELHSDMSVVISVDQLAGVAITFDIQYDSTRFETDTVNPPQCPKLSAIATLNDDVMLTSDQTPTKIVSSCGPIEYECASPTFTLAPTAFDATASSLHFSLSDSSGVYDIDVGLPEVSLDGPSVLTPQKTVSATLSPAGIVPTQVVIGAPESGIVFFDVTQDLIPKAGGFSFIMPTIDLTASSESLANPNWDAGVSSCGQGGATLPCNAALEVVFDPIFNRCDFGTCLVEPPASQGGSASGASSGAASGTVFLPVLLASGASDNTDDAGASDASANGD